MAKLFSTVLVATLLWMGLEAPRPALTQTCASNCGDRPIQFTPGQPIRVQMVNRTSSLIQIEQVFQTDPVALLPGEEIRLDLGAGTTPNLSIVFWDATALPLRAAVSQPEPDLLRVELRPGGEPSDRSIYVQNDGRVQVF